MTRKTTKPKPEKRRSATVSDVLAAVTSDAVVGLLLKRTVTAAVAHGALERLRSIMTNANGDPRVQPLIEHLAREQANGASLQKLKATRVVGEVVDYKGQRRAENGARFLVIPLGTLGDAEGYSVAFGADRVIIGRKGEVSAAEIGVAPLRTPEEVLEELRARTGVELKPTGTVTP